MFVVKISLLLVIVSSELLGIFQVFRHGARTPLKLFSWDQSLWEDDLGELTQEGVVQHYLLGREYRERYIVQEKLVSEAYNINQIYVRTTDFHRTIMSAQAFLMGLYPNGPKLSKLAQDLAVPPFIVPNLETIKNELGDSAVRNNFQPIAFDVELRNKDNLLLGYGSSCEKIKKIIEDTQNNKDYQEKVAAYSDLKIHLKQIFSEEISFEEAGYLYDAIDSVRFHMYPIPNELTDDLLEELEEIRNYCNSYFFENKGAYLASSKFFRTMTDGFRDIIAKNTTVKWNLFFAHDTTLIGFLKALGLWDQKNPVFASSLVFELRKEAGQYFVKIILNDNELKIKECDENLCGVEKFKDIVNAWIIDDVEKECKADLKQIKALKNHFRDEIS